MEETRGKDFCHACGAWVNAIASIDRQDHWLVCPGCDKILFEAEVRKQRVQEEERRRRPKGHGLFEAF
jgi:hypothetical protein